MCQKRSTRNAIIRGKRVRVDHCLKHLIENINGPYLHTLGSCCGHHRYPMTIVAYSDADAPGRIFDICSGIDIPRRKKFYKLDKKGFYFIPEVSKEKCGS